MVTRRVWVAGLVVAVLLGGCRGGEVEVAATPEPTIAPPATIEPTPEPSDEPESEESDESEEPEPVPTIGEGEPLFAPLPELIPDPDNDIPDDLEQLILDAFAAAYETEYGMYAAGRLDEDALRETHALDAFDDVVRTLESMADGGLIEFSGDSEITRVFIREFAGGAAIVRECVLLGERTGEYEAATRSPVNLVDPGEDAREVLIELVGLDETEPPRFRVTDIVFTDREGCDA